MKIKKKDNGNYVFDDGSEEPDMFFKNPIDFFVFVLNKVFDEIKKLKEKV